MKQRLKLLLAAASLLFCVAAVPATHAAAYDPFKTTCTPGGAKSSPACTTNGSNPITGKNGIVYKAANILSIITGVAAVIVIIVAGFGYINSAGDTSKASGARKAIIGAVVGLLVVLFAQTIIIFVLNRIH
jgi:hypothetical protein